MIGKSAREFLSRLSLVLGSSLAAVLLCELILIVAGYRYTPLRIEVQRKSDWRNFHAFEDSSFVSDSYLIWRPKAGAAIFNSQGYRGRELSAEKKPGEIRIFAIGDSNTLGWGEPDGPNWPSYLGQMLTRSNPGIVVVNAGAWGYSSFQGRRWLEGVLRFDPDLVLISFGSNDAHQVTIPDSDFVNMGGRRLGLSFGETLHKLRFGQLVLAASDQVFRKEKETLVSRVSLSEYRANLQEMIRLVESQKAKTILLTRPYTGESRDVRWWKHFAPSYNAAVLEVARGAGVSALDVYGHFQDKPDLFADESHFTESGHRAMAEFIHDGLPPLTPR